ncbi:MAG: hypothetical protein CMN25_08990 [Salinicola sp.]|uniref:DUF6586 family protein n=1 Tax=uncultured Salinicola sp. TaxID=1193542 RepID=UPI000C976045|nr:DUF6586 family protein [uncultured Salinicola sp.]MAM57455.1 hypothetical protein [Salinicola sp.]
MTSPARTNQLLYQAELLLAIEPGDDEHAMARRMALEEAALGQLELALDALLREVTEHTDLPHDGWRAWLGATSVSVAELERLRGLAGDPDSWLALLLSRAQALHGDDGASRRAARSGLIASGGEPALGDTLRWCLGEFKALLSDLREGSSEW